MVSDFLSVFKRFRKFANSNKLCGTVRTPDLVALVDYTICLGFYRNKATLIRTHTYLPFESALKLGDINHSTHQSVHTDSAPRPRIC